MPDLPEKRKRTLFHEIQAVNVEKYRDRNVSLRIFCVLIVFLIL